MTYQYSNFGVPGLGLKRGLSENRVIAPYATGLAAMVDSAGGGAELCAAGGDGGRGPLRLLRGGRFHRRPPAGRRDHAIVRSFMAHHQGMTITAIANAVHDGLLRARFHAEPMIQAVDLLLQERVPRDVAIAPPRADEVLVTPSRRPTRPAVRRFEAPAAAPPTAHLLSNGSYGVMLTPTGAGYSRWRDLAVTRWRAEADQSALGSFIFLRDVTHGRAVVRGAATSGRHPGAPFGSLLRTSRSLHPPCRVP